jgi:hypothetical protein
VEELDVVICGDINDETLLHWKDLWKRYEDEGISHRRTFPFGWYPYFGWTGWRKRSKSGCLPKTRIWMSDLEGLDVPVKVEDVVGRGECIRSW